MANNRSQISYGSSGDDVKELQKLLNANGYNLDIDGIWGDQTDDAVRKYQKQSGLTVDGIVGTQTWGSLYGDNNTNTPNTNTEPKSYSDIDLTKYNSGYQKSQAVQTAEQNKSDAEYALQLHGEYNKSDAVKSAEDKKYLAENAVKNYGDFNYSDQATLDGIINKILNRQQFSYDLNGDALYQQYKDKYVQQGKMAMQDTMGQAAAMTGGYGNSYAAMVGNQAYQSSLQNLNDVIPELYQLAYDRYKQEGQDMYNQYSMLADDRNTEYGVWGDKYNRLVSDRDYYGNEANNAYAKDYGQWSDRYNQLAADRDYYANNANNAYAKDYGQWSDQRDYDTNQYWTETEFGYGQDRDAEADRQWQAQFDEAKRQYDNSMAFNREQYEYQKKQAASSGASSGGSGLNSLSPSEYNTVMSTIDGYVADGNNNGLKSYLNGLVNRGWLTNDEAADMWDQYGGEGSGTTDVTVTPYDENYGKKVTR